MIRAARYLGVAPWELENQSKQWIYQAITAQNAEHWAEAEADKMALKKAKR